MYARARRQCLGEFPCVWRVWWTAEFGDRELAIGPNQLAKPCPPYENVPVRVVEFFFESTRPPWPRHRARDN